MTQSATVTHVPSAREFFDYYDVAKRGALDAGTLKCALLEVEFECDDDKLAKLMASFGRSGDVEFEPFLRYSVPFLILFLIPFHSIPFHSDPFCSVLFRSVLFRSVPSYSIPFHLTRRIRAFSCGACRVVARRVRRAESFVRDLRNLQKKKRDGDLQLKAGRQSNAMECTVTEYVAMFVH